MDWPYHVLAMKFTIFGMRFRIYPKRSNRVRLVWSIGPKQNERVFQSEKEARAAARIIAKDYRNRTVTITEKEYDRFMEWKAAEDEKKATMTVAEAVDKFVEARLVEGSVSNQHISGSKSRLRMFAQECNVRVGELTKEMVAKYIASRNGNETTKKNHMIAINMFMGFCVKEGITKNPLRIEIPKAKPAPVEVIRPEHMELIIRKWPTNGLILIYLGGAFGIRSAEIARLRLGNLREDGIVLDVDITKTAKRRLIPYRHVSRERLLELCGERGVIDHIYNLKGAMGYYFTDTSNRKGIPWVRNGLRHSWCSYSMALSGDPSTVSYEAGNSPTILGRNYLNLVTKRDAEEYFSVFR